MTDGHSHGDAHGGHANAHGTQADASRREPVIFALILAGILLVPLSLLFVLKLPLPIALAIILVLLAALLLAPRIVEIRQYERGVQFQFGKYQKTLAPGWHGYFPAFQTIEKVDMRTQVLDIEPQDVLTSENISLHIETVVYVRVDDPKKVVLEVREVHKAASELIHGELRARIGRLTMNQTIENTEALNHDLEAAIQKVEHDWGIRSVSVEITQIRMPPELEESYLKQKEADQYKQKIETEAQARRDAIQTIKDATENMSPNTLAYLYMETLKKVADGRASKLIYPMEFTHLAQGLADKIKNSNKPLDDAFIRELADAYLKSQADGKTSARPSRGPQPPNAA